MVLDAGSPAFWFLQLQGMAIKKPIRRSAIRLTNLCLLVIVLIGLPAVASLRVGGLALSSVEIRHQLVFWSAAVAVVANLWASRVLARDAAGRRSCYEWAFVFLVLLLAEWLYHRGYLGFGWLKEALMRLRR